MLRSIIVSRIVVGLGLVLALANGANADRTTPAPMTPEQADLRARDKATSAKRLFDRGEYDAAIGDYREAYRLVPSTGLLYNLGQAYRLAGRCAEASDAYRRYLTRSPDSPYRETAEQNLSAADVCARDTEGGARRDALGGATSTGSDSARDGDPGLGRRRAGLIVAGGGSALVVTGAYFALDAARAADRVSEHFEHGGAWEAIADDDARGRRSRMISRMTLAVGAAAVATGGVLFWTGRRPDRAPAVAIGPQTGGGEVVLSWGF